MILDEIVAYKRAELAESKRRASPAAVAELAVSVPAPLDMAAALDRRGIRSGAQQAAVSEPVRIIAEIKKASPSRGVISRVFDPVATARSYAAGGAAAISVLTETRYFQGSPDYLDDVRRSLGPGGPPLLRKDFIFDPYQVYEARAWGADSLLLIAAILSTLQLKELIDLSRSLRMEPLVEVHNEYELGAAVEGGALIIGINNRDLNTFSVDINTTVRLRPLIPQDRLTVSESGISSREQVRRLDTMGIDAILIGEALMSASDPGARLRELV